MARSSMFALALLGVLGLCLVQGSRVQAEEGGDHKKAPNPGPKTTAFKGTLEDKGATWIKVKLDDKNESIELKADWIKGSKPAKPNEELIKDLKVGGKVEGEWRQGDAARFVVKVKMVEGAAEGAKTEAAKTEAAKTEEQK